MAANDSPDLRAEIAALRATVKRLNRRTQEAESARGEFRRIMERPADEQGIRFVNGSMGRALLAWGYGKAIQERDELIRRIEAAVPAADHVEDCHD